jgi:heat shock protein HslJ
MRTRQLSVLALIVSLLALSACTNPFMSVFGTTSGASSLAGPPTQLSGSSWVLTQLHAGGRSQALVPTAPVTLQFQVHDDTYIGSSGCNYYSGAYAVSGDHLNLKFKSVTQAGCVGPIMSQEVTYLNTMQQVRHFKQSDHVLELKDAVEQVILVFSAA